MTTAPTLTRSAAVDWLDGEIARRSLRDFCERVDPAYASALHTDYLIDQLERLERREFNRLMVFMPPQVGKSYHVAERFPAWYLGRHPKDGVFIASYGADLAERSSRAVRSIITDERYPFDAQLDATSSAADRWVTTTGGSMRAVGVGGGLTGFGAQLGIIDDPIKDRKDADSALIRDNVWDWYRDVVRTRLRAGALMLIMLTRWHEDDLAGRLLNSPGASDWQVLSTPAIAEPGDVLGRPEGEGLCPWDYDSPEQYVDSLPSVAKGDASARSLAALYQQRPAPQEGGMLKRSWMKRRWHTLPPDRLDDNGNPRKGTWILIQTVDTAWSEGVGHDYSVIATWASDGVDRYLLNVWRERVEYPDLKRQVAQQFEDAGENYHGPVRAVFVEDAANGRPLVQELRRTANIPVVGIKPEGSKESRLDAITPWFESGKVLLPDSAPWLDDWIEEHVSFPTGTHDDQVDTTSLALAQLAGRQQMPDVRIDYATRLPNQYPKGSMREKFLGAKRITVQGPARGG